jgi:hypothetical protein
MASGGVPERPGMQQQVSDAPDEPDGGPPTFIGIVNKHAKFLNEISKLQVCPHFLPLAVNCLLKIWLDNGFFPSCLHSALLEVD